MKLPTSEACLNTLDAFTNNVERKENELSGSLYATYMVHISNTTQDKTLRNKTVYTVWSYLSQLNKKWVKNQNLEFRIKKKYFLFGNGVLVTEMASRLTSA